MSASEPRDRPNPIARYGAVAQAFHWVTAIVVLAAFIFGPGGPEQSVYRSARDFERHLHETLGMIVLVLVVGRVLWRLVDSRPAPPIVSRWLSRAATAVQVTLYVLLFALPMTAIGGAWLEGHAITLLGGIRVSSPIATAHDLGATIATIHGWLGDAILYLAGLHALAALWHHFFLKDGVLVSMLPRWIPFRRNKPFSSPASPSGDRAL